MSALANNKQYGWLVVVICNLKMMQSNYDLYNSLWSRLRKTTFNYAAVSLQKPLQELDVHNILEDVQT
jgi:hypothetical protein